MPPDRVAIIGAGLSGLSAAFELGCAGVPFDIYEAANRTGGIVRSSVRDGFLIEHGADSWIAQKPWLEDLARDIGMHAEVVACPAVSPSTWILRGSKLVPMPSGMRLFVPGDLAAAEASELFSEETKHRFREESEHSFAEQPEHDESVADFAERHFGREVVEVLAGPLLAGVYGGDARRLSARSVIPGLVQMEREHGSLIRAVQAGGTAQERSEGIFRTFRRGMQSLTDTLTARIPARSVHLGSHVIRVLRKSSGYSLVTTRGAHAGEDFAAVVLAISVPKAAELLDVELPHIAYSSAATVAFAYDLQLELPYGFGFLAAHGEKSAVMAATFVHQKWPWRVPEGKSLIRAFVSDPRLLSAPDGALTLAGQDALREILHIREEPLFAVIDRWPNTMPQYDVGHSERVRQIKEAVAEFGTVYLAGNAYDGVGMPDAVRSGREAGRAAATSTKGADC